MDLFQADVGAINSGNMRSQAAESANEAFQFHNSELAKQAQGIRQQGQQALSAQRSQQAISGVMSGFMGAKGLKDGIDTFKNYRAAQAATANKPNTTTEPNITATPEGAAAQGTADPNPSAVEHGAITAGEEDTGKTGSMFHKGLKSITGISDEAIDRVGRGVGALGSAATAGLDIYNDVKQGKMGDNGWESVGQVAQIGGAISDVVGTAFPPAELLGGALGLVGGIFSDIGEVVDGKKKEADAKEADQQAQEKAQQAQVMAVAPTAQIAAAPRVSS